MIKDHSKCQFSTGICGTLTAGQGKLDDNGYWEFPCPECVVKFKLQPATTDQFNAAKEQAEEYMKYGGGNNRYYNAQSCARSAIIEYILYTQGLRAIRK